MEQIGSPVETQIVTLAIAPPYDAAQRVADAPQSLTARGVIIALRPLKGVSIEGLTARICDLQRKLPHATVTLWLDLVSRQNAAEMIAAAAEYSIRGYVVAGAPDLSVLRSQLTSTRYIHTDLTYRLRILGFDVMEPARAFIRATCAHAIDAPTVSSVLDIISHSYETLRRTLRTARLGSPAMLHQIVRLIMIALDLQGSQVETVASVAYRYGYYDASALRRRFNEVLGAPPSAIQSWLGWESLLVTGLRRAAHP